MTDPLKEHPKNALGEVVENGPETGQGSVLSPGRAESEKLQGGFSGKRAIRAKTAYRKRARRLGGKTTEKIERQMAIAATTLPRNWAEIRKRIIKRDGGVCVMCGSRDRITAHHIDGNEQNNRPSNLMTVCLDCHGLFPVPPFSERFYCKTMMIGDRRHCLKGWMGREYADPAKCAVFSRVHGCLLEAISMIGEG